MAKCKLCKKLIADETEYCADCADKKDLVANESYLDDLLNSVQNKATTAASHIYKKKKEDPSGDSPNISVHPKKDASNFIDSDDLEDFDDYDFMKEFDDPIVISDEELYGELVTPTEISINPTDEGQAYTINPSDEADQEDTENNIDNEFLEMTKNEEGSIIEDEHIEPVLDDLLRHLDLDDDKDNLNDYDSIQEDIDSFETPEDKNDTYETSFEELHYMQASETNIAPENELLDLLNQFNPDNPVEDDIQAISDLLGGISANNQQEKEYPEDVGEVFSEALEAVSDLEDPDQDVQHINQETAPSDKKKVAKGKKEKKTGFFTKLFANIDDEDLIPEEKKTLEEAAAAKEKKKKKKKAKSKKAQTTNQEEGDEVSARPKAEEESADDSKKKKKDKKEKKKKIEILDEEVDLGKINKAGASIVFLFFGILVILLLISTNIFSYSLSIKNASDYFGRQRYTQAYNEVYGIELRDEDIELYDKIMTVMYVNKQLNSYNNYYHMRKFPEALDSLLKGLHRYDKYIELATMLGIKTDLDYVRNQIIAELYNVFSLTEEQAISILNSESQAKYSIAVYDVILENISFYN
ncbi:MAG: hypothetical protein EWM47_00075 [Anaerolineaceae bacterium]|nr:MAG: hypothetical protein EWM47_00075 [Anaerolineaceae bacterium]